MERNVNNDKRLKPLSHNDLRCWGGGSRLKMHSQSGNYPCDYKVFPYYLEATTRHSERSEESNRKLNQESKNIICHPEETQCPKDLRVSKEIFARDVGEATNIILKPYCLSSGVSGLCPDGIRLEIFKRCNENLLCRSEQKFSLQSFKISFNSAGFSFLWFISFLLPAQSKRKEMNIRKSHFEHSSYLKQESTCQIKHSKLL